ncbi:hypothetical protein [uncultured Acetobacteroides sp.]|uniref:hypothetical protein n=1 Tax=uncultured Acetobacteroides sp. TaxID=1760811 RepID=UPI0029F5AEFA|nr:hypothetical protein [uncultured Acetobacteroides sp.]
MDSNSRDLTNIDDKLQELEELAEVINSLQKNPNHNPDELELLAEVLKTRAHELESFLLKAKQEVDNRLAAQSTAFYFHVKELADGGDAEARKAYEDLRPLYENYLRSCIELN